MRLAAAILLLLNSYGPAISRAQEPEPVFPGETWTRKAPAEVGLDADKLNEAERYALSGRGSGYIVRHGYLIAAWGDERRRYDLKSTTKSIGATALGVAVLDGKISLDDFAVKHHPSFGIPPESNRDTGWLGQITIRHLATHTAGFEKPGGYTKLTFEPGTKWAYSDGGPNWLAECVTFAYRRDVADWMFERVFSPIGITRDDLAWRANSYRAKEIEGVARREFGSGVSANVNAMARLGYLYLRDGLWNGRQILPRDFVREAAKQADLPRVPVIDGKSYGKASQHYGLLWWNNSDGTIDGVPRDAFWSWGLYDSLIVVIPSLDIVVARAGESWKRDSDDHYAVLGPFLKPIVAAAQSRAPREANKRTSHDDLLERVPRKNRARIGKAAGPPYSPSRLISAIEWAPASEIIRKARGGDNWPVTWGDDDQLYTAYGDGKGFEPFIDIKLSMGLARVRGAVHEFIGENLRSASLETIGDGAKGKKASGILMVDGTLYLWARNAGNSQLAWSTDRGQTWQWSRWKFEKSFGCPTFLNFGPNYAGARDSFVYVYSHDNDSAYEPADRMVLARVPADRIRDRSAYEFFAGTEASEPKWTANLEDRSAVFTHEQRCYRSGISYNAPLKRYLWCQTLPGPDTRFEGGFGIYDAPEPWGPWTTVFFTESWDVGPGETSSIPTKWISDDGRTIHLVFSGDDHFSVRRATLTLSWE